MFNNSNVEKKQSIYVRYNRNKMNAMRTAE